MRAPCVFITLMLGCASPAAPDACSLDSIGDVFDRRVRPLLAGGPSSCNQCHLSGVTLANYVRKDPCHTMACMALLGEVDLETPAASKILERIQRAEPQSALITQAVIDQEAAGMLAWIQHAAACPTQCGDVADPCGSGQPDWAQPEDTPLGGCDEATLSQRFDALVFKWRGRCGACHIPSGGTIAGAPAWVDFQSAERTMYNVLGMRSLDLVTPRLSPFLTKPLSVEHPDGVAHGGGDKFQDVSDPTYQDILQWITEYATCHKSGAGAAPSVTITAPVPDAWFPAAAPVTLTGAADDPQEGPLPDTSHEWFADGQPLGVGRTVTTSLPTGYVVVTLSASDADGNVGSRSAKVFVGGGCSGADRDSVLDPERFDAATRSCGQGCSTRECLEACAAKTWSGACAACVAGYLICFEAACGDVCQDASDECGRCVTAQCAEAWSDCSGLREPFADH